MWSPRLIPSIPSISNPINLSILFTFLIYWLSFSLFKKRVGNDSWRSSGKRTNSRKKEKKTEKRKKRKSSPSSERKNPRISPCSIDVYYMHCALVINCSSRSFDFNKFLLSSIAIGASSSYKICNFFHKIKKNKKIEESIWKRGREREEGNEWVEKERVCARRVKKNKYKSL